MEKTPQQLNEELIHAEFTLSHIVESCEDWLNSIIQEPSVEMITAIQKWIIKRHPNTAKVIGGLEY